MNKHAGPACALSVLIVGVFAVILHDKNPPAIVAKSVPSTASRSFDQDHSSRPKAPDQEMVLGAEVRKGSSNPPQTLPSPTPASVPSPIQREPIPKVVETAKERDVLPPTDRAKPTNRPEPDRLVRPIPRKTAFTVVQEGEKLTDVATRVYGSTDSTESLWRANRDQVAMIDSPLPRGTLLRTP